VETREQTRKKLNENTTINIPTKLRHKLPLNSQHTTYRKRKRGLGVKLGVGNYCGLKEQKRGLAFGCQKVVALLSTEGYEESNGSNQHARGKKKGVLREKRG